MGYENRDYHRDGWDTGSGWKDSRNGNTNSFSGWSMVTKLIIVNVAVFALDMIAGGEGQVMSWLSLESNLYQVPWNIWHLLTHGFAHTPLRSELGIFHIAGNMLVLFFLGRPLEMKLGATEFLKFYLVAILVSGVGYVLLSIGGPVRYALGASGAVSAVVALFIFLYPRQKLLFFGIIPMPAWVVGVIVVVTDVGRAFDPNNSIAWQSHLAGFAFGAIYFYRNWNFRWLQLEKIPDLFKSRPKLKVHRESSLDKIKRQADDILQKINEQGEASLTASERKILQKYSEQVRNQRD